MHVVKTGKAGEEGTILGEFKNLQYAKIQAGKHRKSLGAGGWSEIKTPDGEVIRVEN